MCVQSVPSQTKAKRQTWQYQQADCPFHYLPLLYILYLNISIFRFDVRNIKIRLRWFYFSAFNLRIMLLLWKIIS